MTAYTTANFVELAEKLEVPVCLIEYLHECYEDEQGELDGSFEFYIADRIADATYVRLVYSGVDIEDADEESANVFSEVCELLELTVEDLE